MQRAAPPAQAARKTHGGTRPCHFSSHLVSARVAQGKRVESVRASPEIKVEEAHGALSPRGIGRLAECEPDHASVLSSAATRQNIALLFNQSINYNRLQPPCLDTKNFQVTCTHSLAICRFELTAYLYLRFLFKKPPPLPEHRADGSFLDAQPNPLLSLVSGSGPNQRPDFQVVRCRVHSDS